MGGGMYEGDPGKVGRRGRKDRREGGKRNKVG